MAERKIKNSILNKTESNIPDFSVDFQISASTFNIVCLHHTHTEVHIIYQFSSNAFSKISHNFLLCVY